MMVTPAIEHSIRTQFPGRHNAGLRAQVRQIVRLDGEVRLLRYTVALTAWGRASLEAVAQVVDRVREERTP